MMRPMRAWWLPVLFVSIGCTSASPEAAPVAANPNSPAARTIALQAAGSTLAEGTAALAEVDDAGREAVCDGLSEQVARLWAATRRAALDEAEKRAVAREGDPIPPTSKRREDDLMVNYETDGFAELAALGYQLRWGGWREAGSRPVLEHLLSTTGISMNLIQAACDPASGVVVPSAECHARTALDASVVVLDACP